MARGSRPRAAAAQHSMPVITAHRLLSPLSLLSFQTSQPMSTQRKAKDVPICGTGCKELLARSFLPPGRAHHPPPCFPPPGLHRRASVLHTATLITFGGETASNNCIRGLNPQILCSGIHYIFKHALQTESTVRHIPPVTFLSLCYLVPLYEQSPFLLLLIEQA